MVITELIARLQEILAEKGDLEVTYIDNGPFAEDVPEIEPQVCDNWVVL